MFCRHPIPSHYALGLNVYPDRTTAATSVACSNTDARLPDCPSGSVEGDEVVQRMRNEPCEHLVSDVTGSCDPNVYCRCNELTNIWPATNTMHAPDTKNTKISRAMLYGY